ncbi:MAG: antitoxin family protein [Desulfurobacteriaceae bacterium]
MKAVKVVFKNGVFIPLEDLEVPEGTEGIVVYVEKNVKIQKPSWWNKLNLEKRKKEALLNFSKEISKKVIFNDIKVTQNEEGIEVFVLVENEFESLKTIMETALKIYESSGVYLPIQVISQRRLQRWKEKGNPVYQTIDNGISIK